jgi:hypothetical protein
MNGLELTKDQKEVLSRLGIEAGSISVSQDNKLTLSEGRSNTLMRLNPAQKSSLAGIGFADIEGVRVDPLSLSLAPISATEAATITAIWGEAQQ